MSPPAGGANPQTALRGRLLGLIERALERPGAGPALPPEASLSELGLSSLKMVSLMLSIEVEFDLAIPQSEITPQNFRSISSIETLLGRLIGAAT